MQGISSYRSVYIPKFGTPPHQILPLSVQHVAPVRQKTAPGYRQAQQK